MNIRQGKNKAHKREENIGNDKVKYRYNMERKKKEQIYMS